MENVKYVLRKRFITSYVLAMKLFVSEIPLLWDNFLGLQELKDFILTFQAAEK